jgi:deoxyribose-phosphate aldolase
MIYSPRQIAEHLDLAVLQPNAMQSEVHSAIMLAKWKGIKSVCVPPVYTRYTSNRFPCVSTVIGFPHGNSEVGCKINESYRAICHGTHELDVVLNYGRFISGYEKDVRDELACITKLAHESCVLVKAILETCHYSEAHLKRMCEICIDNNVDFVKTSTGFGPKGATPSVVTFLLQCLKGSGVQVKASGGIKTYDDASLYLDLGCTRFGASNYWEVSGESK